MTREPWFRATWTGFMPIHRTGWLLTLGAAAVVTVLVAAGVLMFQATGETRWVAGLGLGAFAVVGGLFAIALPRTQWGRGR